MEMKVWMIIIYSLVALCQCAPAQVDDNAERAKRGCSSPKAQPGEVYYKDCTKFECKKKRRTFVWEETLDSGVCCIVENKRFPVGSVIFTNSTADNCTISTLTCRNIGNLPSLVYQDQDNQCNNEELLEVHANLTEEALEIIKMKMERMEMKIGRMEMHANHTEELLVEHANHTEELLVEHSNHTEELLDEHANLTEEALDIMKMEMGKMERHANHTEELLVEQANHTAELLEHTLERMTIEMEKIKTLLDNLLNKTAIESPGPSAATTNTTTSTTSTTTTTKTTTAATPVQDPQCLKRYTTLSATWRQIRYGVKQPAGAVHCDKPGNAHSTDFTEGWHRFKFPNAPYATIPTTPPLEQYRQDMSSCGTYAVSWMEGTLPVIGDPPKDVNIYWAWGDNEKWSGTKAPDAKVVACAEDDKTMFLYYLPVTWGCTSAYCAL